MDNIKFSPEVTKLINKHKLLLGLHLDVENDIHDAKNNDAKLEFANKCVYANGIKMAIDATAALLYNHNILYNGDAYEVIDNKPQA